MANSRCETWQQGKARKYAKPTVVTSSAKKAVEKPTSTPIEKPTAKVVEEVVVVTETPVVNEVLVVTETPDVEEVLVDTNKPATKKSNKKEV